MAQNSASGLLLSRVEQGRKGSEHESYLHNSTQFQGPQPNRMATPIYKAGWHMDTTTSYLFSANESTNIKEEEIGSEGERAISFTLTTDPMPYSINHCSSMKREVCTEIS